jgi:ABC-type lipoprotein release transport system permease subunit
MRGLLYDVAAADPVALGVATVVLASVAVLASLVPARRAMRVSPLEALRID